MNEIEKTGGAVAPKAAAEVCEGRGGFSHSGARRRGVPWRMVLWAAVVACLAGLILPAVRVAAGADMGGGGAGRAICRVLWRMGLPPIGESLWAVWGLDPSEGEESETERDTVPEAGTEAPADTVEEDTETTEATETVQPPEANGETTAEPLPDGAIPVVRQDKSESHRGADYLYNPASLPVLPTVDERPWSTAGTPAVLIVHSHPREAYGDGGDYLTAGESGVALAPVGVTEGSVVSLGAALTERLRAVGITVIHLRAVAEAGESYADTYEYTERMIRYYTTLYPDIGLVLDLRRSAESADGGLLATCGTWNGKDLAQLRITVDGLRGEADAARDVAVAQSLRAGLWTVSPTLCRPVYLRRSEGLGERCGGTACAVMLTLELGAAGNTYAEAEALIEPLVEALAKMLKE